MFTGIIQAIGQIARLENLGGDTRLHLRCPDFNLTHVRPGDSISVNGVCLTVVNVTGKGFSADVSRETLSLTTLGKLSNRTRVNLESSLTLATPLGGHLVSGHVDGIGEILEMKEDARSLRLKVKTPIELRQYFARKGSIAIDGASLTVNDIVDTVVAINIVPHTWTKTIIEDYRLGTLVNIEVDLIARYLERLMLCQGTKDIENSTISKDVLSRSGFI